jgi:two-component system, NtrC family, response regulator AtoC
MRPARVLVVDDDPGMLRYMRTLLQLSSHQVTTASNAEEAVRQIQEGLCPDIVFLDVMMPGVDGLQTIQRLLTINPRIPVVMVSCMKDPAKIVQAMRLGAQDYLPKPVDGHALETTMERCLAKVGRDHSSLLAEVSVEELPNGAFFASAGPTTRKTHDHIRQVAGVDVPVLLLGESGTGKEIAAMLIHKWSPRAERMFLKVNCAAIPAELLESELFGYEAGAFTGATQAKPGKFEICDQGTILLDEIGEMPAGLQAKLLQVLQEQRFFRLGARSTVSVDVRILAATNINVNEAIKQGKLRLDLYYRLNAFTIEVPPLRQRRDEIPALFELHMQRLSDRYRLPPRTPSAAMMDACMQHSWPGNLRELHNLAKRLLVLGDESAIIAELNAVRNTPSRSVLPAATAGQTDLKKMMRRLKGDAEAQVIQQALEQANWNRRAAAQLLNLSYKALSYKIRQYGIEIEGASSALPTGRTHRSDSFPN